MVFTRFSAALLIAWLPLAAMAAPVTVQEADQAFRQGHHSAALDKVNSFLTANPKDAQGRFLKGLILTELNRYADAIKVFSGLTDDYPELPEPYNNLAVLYAAQGQYEQAKQSLEMAIRTHPSYTTAHENLGDIYAKMASQAYDKALQLDKSNTSAQTKLALIRELFSPTPRSAEPIKVAAKSSGKAAKAEAATKAAEQAKAAEAPKVAETAKPAEPAKAAEPAKPAEPVRTTEAAKPAEAAPAKATEPAKAADKPAATEARPDTPEKLLHAWAEAWSRQDVPAYLGYYGKNFAPPKGMDRAAWEAERKERIERAKSIQVAISEVKVRVKGDTAKVKFRQHYASNRLKSDSHKTVRLERISGNWLIVEER